MSEAGLKARVVEVGDALEAVEYCYQQGWTDGLPVVPPAEEKVTAMLSAVSRDPYEVLGEAPPRGAVATVEAVAINAVMAGCKPEYFPVVLAAVEAALDPRFNLNGVQCTTHCCAPLVIVNGPIRNQIGLNCGHNVFGQGFRANATIGRALRLVMMNLGGGYPETGDKSTFGHPGKYTYCIGEYEEENPWEPLHVERGFDRQASAVTVYAAEAPHQVNNHPCRNPRGILISAASVLAAIGNNNIHRRGQTMLVMAPEHAQTIAAAGWTKHDVQNFLFERARVPVALLREAELLVPEVMGGFPRWLDMEDSATMVPVVDKPEDILIVVAGGKAGRFSMALPGWGALGTEAVTKPIAA